MSTIILKRNFPSSRRPSAPHDPIDDGSTQFIFHFEEEGEHFTPDMTDQSHAFDMEGFEHKRAYEDKIVIPTFLQQIVKASFGKELRTVTVEPIQVSYTLNAAGGYTLEI